MIDKRYHYFAAAYHIWMSLILGKYHNCSLVTNAKSKASTYMTWTELIDINKQNNDVKHCEHLYELYRI